MPPMAVPIRMPQVALSKTSRASLSSPRPAASSACAHLLPKVQHCLYSPAVMAAADVRLCRLRPFFPETGHRPHTTQDIPAIPLGKLYVNKVPSCYLQAGIAQPWHKHTGRWESSVMGIPEHPGDSCIHHTFLPATSVYLMQLSIRLSFFLLT